MDYAQMIAEAAEQGRKEGRRHQRELLWRLGLLWAYLCLVVFAAVRLP